MTYKDIVNQNFVQKLSIEQSHQPVVSKKRQNFPQNPNLPLRMFARGFEYEEANYIKDFPIYLKKVGNKLPIEFFLEQKRFVNLNGSEVEVNIFVYILIKYAVNTASDNLILSEAALYSISKLLKIDSVQILDLIIKTNVELNGKITTFCLQLPFIIQSAKTIIQKKSLLKCIAAISGVIPKIAETFHEFFVEQLQITQHDRSLKKAAASSATQIIKIYPLSEFSKNIMKDLPFDYQDPELSKYCFLALEAQCEYRNYDCFDASQIVKYACECDNRISFDAIHVIYIATCDSVEMCNEFLRYIVEFNFLLYKMKPKRICSIINNIVKRGKIFAEPFLSLIASLNELYYECALDDKICIARTICLIILNSRPKPSKEMNPICDTLIEAINHDDDIVIIIIETLKILQYFSDDFRDAVLNLIDSEDEVIAYYAISTLNEIDQIISEN